MRFAYVMAGAILLSLYFVSYSAAQGIAGSSCQSSQNGFNQSFNQTLAYVSVVGNESYFVFYPNLEPAYSYLNKSIKVSGIDLGAACGLLAKAQQSASAQETYLNGEKEIAASVAVILTLLSVAALAAVARPKKFIRKNKNNPR